MADSLPIAQEIAAITAEIREQQRMYLNSGWTVASPDFLRQRFKRVVELCLTDMDEPSNEIVSALERLIERLED